MKVTPVYVWLNFTEYDLGEQVEECQLFQPCDSCALSSGCVHQLPLRAAGRTVLFCEGRGQSWVLSSWFDILIPE